MSNKDPHRYDDIIDLPRHISHNRKHMSNYERAAQFAPFAALTGYSQSINEAGRLTDDFIQLGENSSNDLNIKFMYLSEHIKDKPEITVRYFIPDVSKDGGSYKTETVNVYRIDMFERVLITTDKRKIDLDYIVDIDADLFAEIDNY